MDQNVGKLIITIGFCVMIGGLAIYFFHDKLNWIGRLPGDIRIEKENSKFYFPITSMILFSILLNIVLKVYRYFVG